MQVFLLIVLRVACCLIVLLECAIAQDSQSLKPLVRARVEPDSKVTVGQPISVIVEVLVPSWFTGAPKFPALDLRDAIVIFTDRGSNFSEQINGETWAGQSREYTIYPQRAGSYAIPNIPVEVRYYAEGAGTGKKATSSPPSLTFTANIPEEAKGLSYFIAARKLDLSQQFDRKPTMLKVGEAFTRTLTVTVHDALSMVIPPVPVDPIEGLGVYPDPAVVNDSGGERGEMIVGTRVESVTYIAQQEGDYRLNPIEFVWWDVDTKQLRRAQLPAVQFHVEPKLAFDSEIPLPAEVITEDIPSTPVKKRISLLALLKQWGVPLGLAVLIIVLLVKLIRRYGPYLRDVLAKTRQRRAESEATEFGKFRQAARSGHPEATLRHLMFWLDRTHRDPGAATLRSFTDEVRDPLLDGEVEKLEEILFDSPDRYEQATPGMAGKYSNESPEPAVDLFPEKHLNLTCWIR